MTRDEALEVLADKETIPLMTGSVPNIKELHEKCLANDIPAAIKAPPSKGKG